MLSQLFYKDPVPSNASVDVHLQMVPEGRKWSSYTRDIQQNLGLRQNWCDWLAAMLSPIYNHSSFIRSLKRRLGLGCNSSQVPPLATLPINECRMQSHAIVPHYNCFFSPFHPCLKIGPVSNVVVEESEQRIAFFLFITDNVSGDWKMLVCESQTRFLILTLRINV
jgi:hypothetical protein